MDLQQSFGTRLFALLEEKNISQGEFAEKMGCSRQSINFYILGRRSPDIALASKMAEFLGVSCDYLIGFSDFRTDKEANLSVNQVGLSEEAMKFFAGLKLMTLGKAQNDKSKSEELSFTHEEEILRYNMVHSQAILNLLNSLISHDRFGILLQYIKRYRDICHGEDELTLLKDFMFELESPFSGIKYGTKQENQELLEEFCLHVISKYLDEIIKDITK